MGSCPTTYSHILSFGSSYVCMYVDTCTHTHIYIHIHTHKYIPHITHTLFVPVRASTWPISIGMVPSSSFECSSNCTSAWHPASSFGMLPACVYTFAYVCVCVKICIYAYIHAHIHANMHIHTLNTYTRRYTHI